MHSAKVSFAVMKYMGIWQPKSWTSKWAIYCYGFYRLLIIFAFMSFAFTILIYIFNIVEDLDSLTESVLVLSAFCSLGMKMLIILINREKIIAFDNLFLESICIPRDSQEAALQKEFEHTDRVQSISILTMCFIAISITTLNPLLSSSKDLLPCDKTWIPYRMESRVLFWITYIYQTTILMALTVLIYAIDVLVFTTMQRICTQLEIFKYRLNLLPKLLEEEDNEKSLDSKRELEIIEDWILYHTHIYEIGKMLNDIFSSIIFAQYFITTVALCITIYHLAKEKLTSSTFWFMLGAFNNYMVEIFFYCWFGEGMISKSIEIATAVYEMNWNFLTINSKRCLLMIMIRARRPIELIGASMVTMSLDTLVKIMKVSYSAFSVLKSSSD